MQGGSQEVHRNSRIKRRQQAFDRRERNQKRVCQTENQSAYVSEEEQFYLPVLLARSGRNNS